MRVTDQPSYVKSDSGCYLATGKKLKTSNLLLKEGDSSTFHIRNSGDTGFRDIALGLLSALTGIKLGNDGVFLSAPYGDNGYAVLQARENGVGQAEIARLVGAADPTTLVEGMLWYLDSDDRLYYRRASDTAKLAVDNASTVSAGDLLIYSNDWVMTLSDTPTYTKKFVIPIPLNGTIRVKFDVWFVSGNGSLAYGRIYRNGTAVGTEQSTTSTSFVTMSEDISGWSAGDACELYIHAQNTLDDVEAQNLRVYIA